MLQMGDSPREIKGISRLFILALNMEKIFGCADVVMPERPRRQRTTWSAPTHFHMDLYTEKSCESLECFCQLVKNFRDYLKTFLFKQTSLVSPCTCLHFHKA